MLELIPGMKVIVINDEGTPHYHKGDIGIVCDDDNWVDFTGNKDVLGDGIWCVYPPRCKLYTEDQ